MCQRDKNKKKSGTTCTSERKIIDRLLIWVFSRGLPCGVQPPEPVPDPDGDKLATIAARFSYFQERKNTLAVAKADLRRNINPPARYKNARPTVRLRPRQVLCSKCRSICNENSENVDVSRKRKHDDVQQPQQPQQQQVLNFSDFLLNFTSVD